MLVNVPMVINSALMVERAKVRKYVMPFIYIKRTLYMERKVSFKVSDTEHLIKESF